METSPSRRTDLPGYPWRIFWILTLACVLGFAAGLPYIYALFRNLVAPVPLVMPLPVLVTVQLMQSTIVFGGMVALGLLLARKVGIEAPVLRGWLYRDGTARPRGWLGAPLGIGLGIGLFVSLGYLFIFLPLIPAWPVQAEAALPLWQRFFVCFYTAIDIEIVMRLFLLSLVLWLLQAIARLAGRATASPPSPVSFWIANAIVALIYAFGHMPAAKSLMPLTPVVVTAVLLPTGLSALAFGYLAWKRGIEAAILAHFSADVVLHVIGPMVFRG